MIRTALADKQKLVADILHVPHAELESSTEHLLESEGENEASLLVMTALTRGIFLLLPFKKIILHLKSFTL